MAFVQFKKGGNKHFGPRDMREVKAGETVELNDDLLGRYGDALDIVKEGAKDKIDPNAKSDTEDFNEKQEAARERRRQATLERKRKAAGETPSPPKAAASRKKGAAKKGAAKKGAAKG